METYLVAEKENAVYLRTETDVLPNGEPAMYLLEPQVQNGTDVLMQVGDALPLIRNLDWAKLDMEHPKWWDVGINVPMLVNKTGLLPKQFSQEPKPEKKKKKKVVNRRPSVDLEEDEEAPQKKRSKVIEGEEEFDDSKVITPVADEAPQPVKEVALEDLQIPVLERSVAISIPLDGENS
jgi:hypothetical protein